MNRLHPLLRIISLLLPLLTVSPRPLWSAETTVTQATCLALNGKAFLPLYVWGEPPSDPWVPYFRSLGLNVFMGNGAGPSADLQLLNTLGSYGMYGILRYNPAVANHPALAGWMHDVEPDVAGLATSSLHALYSALKTSDSKHVVVVNLADGFYNDASYSWTPPALNGDRTPYYGYMNAADVASFAIYPVTGWNRPDWLYVPGASVPVLFSQYGQGRRPVWPLIEAGDQDLTSTPPETPGPTAQEVRFEVWDSIIGGATGIGFFTLAFNPSRWASITASVEAEMRRTNSQIASLKDVLLLDPPEQGPLPAFEADGKPFHYLTRRTGGRRYLFVVNADMNRTAETVTFTFPQLLGGVKVIGESRWIAPSGPSLTDSLPPLEARAYEISYLPPSTDARDFYVSRQGNNTDGRSWATAWNELNQIKWSQVLPGDFIYLDGGVSSATYTTPLATQKGGASRSARITIRRSEEPAHDGAVHVAAQIRIWHPYVTLDGGDPDKFNIYPTDPMCGVFIGYWTQDARGSELRNVSLRGAYATTSGISVSVYSADCTIGGCVFDQSAGEDMLAVMTAGDVTVEECRFANLVGSGSPASHRDAISTYPGTAPGSVFVLRNNLFENNKTDNFTVFPNAGAILGGFEICGNTFAGCNTAIHFDDRLADAQFISVYGNLFQDVGLPIHNNSPEPIDARYNTVRNGGLPPQTSAAHWELYF